MPRIKKDDTNEEIALKMAAENEGEGCNPGALNVIVRLLSAGVPGSAMLVLLDEQEIYGSDIWLAYKDVCHQDMKHLVKALAENPAALKNAVSLAADGMFSA